MKAKLFAVLFFCIFLNSSYGQNTTGNGKFHNKIDDIKSVEDIDKFLDRVDKALFEDFNIEDELKFKDEKCQKLADALNVKPWTKVDLDNNGYTDLLVIGENEGEHFLIVIMDSKGNNFSVKSLTKGFFPKCSLPVIENNGNREIIKLHTVNPDGTDIQLLTYKSGGVIELNENPKEYKIEKIEYETSMCYGTCPSFELRINSDKTAEYNAKMYNKKEGKYTGKILQSNYDELVGLLNYIDFPNLKDNYSVDWTDDQTSILKITYNNGKVKTIKDYGLIGTFGLSRIYKILIDFRENQQWK